MSLTSGRTAHVRTPLSLVSRSHALYLSLPFCRTLLYGCPSSSRHRFLRALCSTELVGHIQAPGGESFRWCRRTGIVASLSAAGGLVRHFGGAALESRS